MNAFDARNLKPGDRVWYYRGSYKKRKYQPAKVVLVNRSENSGYDIVLSWINVTGGTTKETVPYRQVFLP
jgi:hypothetical protein